MQRVCDGAARAIGQQLANARKGSVCWAPLGARMHTQAAHHRISLRAHAQRTKRLVRALSAAVSAGQALPRTRLSPHAWSNILWCLAKLEVFDPVLVTHCAHAMAHAAKHIQVRQPLCLPLGRGQAEACRALDPRSLLTQHKKQ